MQPRERLAFSPIEGRPPLQLPDGIRMVIWPVLALEDWDISRAMARMVIVPPQLQPLLPDHPNWSWHEYGMRVAFWRLRKVLEKVGAAPTVAINARVCETYPQVIRACLESGWELNAHSYEQMPMHKVEDQKGAIADTIRAIRDLTGKARVPADCRGHRLVKVDDIEVAFLDRAPGHRNPRRKDRDV